jgi:hypothetical protein
MSGNRPVILHLTLVNGERRTLTLRSHTGSVAVALARLDDWIPSDEGSWVHKRYVVEAEVEVPSEPDGVPAAAPAAEASNGGPA